MSIAYDEHDIEMWVTNQIMPWVHLQSLNIVIETANNWRPIHIGPMRWYMTRWELMQCEVYLTRWQSWYSISHWPIRYHTLTENIWLIESPHDDRTMPESSQREQGLSNLSVGGSILWISLLMKLLTDSLCLIVCNWIQGLKLILGCNKWSDQSRNIRISTRLFHVHVQRYGTL